MTDERPEGRGPIPETPQTLTSAPIPGTPHSTASPRGKVAPARAKTSRGVFGRVVKGIANIVFVGLTIYLTYFFTRFFSTGPPAPAPVPESARVAGKKIEELRAEERQLLTTYGPVNPATKTLRIPIDRAMDLIVAEGGRPAPTPAALPTPVSAVATPKAGAVTPAPKAGAVTPAPKAGAVAATPKAGAALPVPKPAPATAPAPAPARVGMAPEQLYRAICMACHDADGRGTIVRKAMPLIPDLTDPKWQASHSDAEMIHTMLDGKGQFMLPMKDKFALARTDPKEMLAFMRSFQPGKTAVAATSPTQAPVSSATAPVVAVSSTAPVGPSAPAPTVSSTTPTPEAPSAAVLALRNASSSPIPNLNVNPSPVPVSPSPIPSAVALTSTPTPAPTPSSASSPAMAARVHVAGEFYSVNCIACHGQDGKGNAAIRVAMPVLPDFTNREWQTSHSNPQLAVAILEGKGGLMPPWRGKVAPALAQDLVAFIRTFGPADLVAANTTTSEFGTRFRKLQQEWQELDQQARALSRP